MLKLLVGVVGIPYHLTTPLVDEVKKAGAIHCGFEAEHVLYTNHNYHKLLKQLDCHLVVISPEEDVEIANKLDLLLIPGGPDVNPSYYDQSPHPETQFDDKRDSFEKQMIKLAIDRGIPIIGVCRGAQLINVVLGGTLYQHLPDHFQQINHRPTVGPSAYSHMVQTTGWLKEQVGESVKVNSWHHQGIDKLAPGLTPLAWAADGLVEAYESTASIAPIFAVQWHPELLLDKESTAMLSYFINHAVRKNVPKRSWN